MRLVAVGAMLLASAALPADAADPGPTPATRSASAPPAISGHGSMAAAPRPGPRPVEHYVDINSAGRTELMTLPGIGAVEADRIIARRPYLTKTELVTRNVLPFGPYVSLKNLVVAMPQARPKGKG